MRLETSSGRSNKFVGEYKDGKLNGQFTVTHANGTKFVGEYKDGKRNGQGTEYASNGSIISQGIWADNKFVSSAPLQQAKEPLQNPDNDTGLKGVERA
jgi:antitoxin component YwqK of YwqJK toxin-antitoxin module